MSLVRYGMPDQYWRSAVGRFYDDLQSAHASRQGKRRWVECVSSPRLSLDQLDRLFPTAQFIRVSNPERPGADGRGERRAAPGTGQEAWIDRRGGRLAPGRYLEVAYDTLVTQPEVCLPAVLDFLREAWSEALLDAARDLDLPTGPAATEGVTETLTARTDEPREVLLPGPAAEIDLSAIGTPPRPGVGRRPPSEDLASGSSSSK